MIFCCFSNYRRLDKYKYDIFHNGRCAHARVYLDVCDSLGEEKVHPAGQVYSNCYYGRGTNCTHTMK